MIKASNKGIEVAIKFIEIIKLNIIVFYKKK